MLNSRQETTTVQCPACATSFDAGVWIVLDALERPDLLADLHNGSLNQQYCPNCHASGVINAPLLFHDSSNERLILALPLSVQTAADAQSLAEQLVGYLHESLQAQGKSILAYQTGVDIAADVDDLRAMIAQPVDAGLQAALEAILASDSPQAFERAVAQHRRHLMHEAVEPILNDLIAQAHAHGDDTLARHISDQQATLGQFRATWQARSAALDSLLAETTSDQATAAALRPMLHAVDPQEVYTARLQLSTEQQAAVDVLLDQLTDHAAQHNDAVLPFLHELQAMRAL